MQQDKAEPRAENGQRPSASSAQYESVSLQQQLEEERRKAEEYLDLLQHTQADFVNYKRRTNQEQGEERLNAQASMLMHLLPVLDDLERALTKIPAELVNNPWVEGLLLARKRLVTTLERMGVRSIGRVGEHFDPRLHEALLTESRADVSDGTITSVVRPGYGLGERVIRPAQVVVVTAV